jgi:hypothetical protein
MPYTRKIATAAVLVLAIALVAYVAYTVWWVYGPWPWGPVVEVQGSGWVVIQTDQGVRYRAWVPKQYRSNDMTGTFMIVHDVGSPFTAATIPW